MLYGGRAANGVISLGGNLIVGVSMGTGAKAEVDRHICELRDTKALPGQSVRLPGEQRAQRHADRLRNGLPLAPELLTQLDKLAAELSIRPLRERG
jgi:LDH2 family malate/lactate/ureidoglycolate dehydrogenase